MLNLSLLGFAKRQLVPLLQMGGQEEKLIFFFFSSTLFVLNALSISALTCFLFSSHPNIPMSASFCNLINRLSSPAILQRGDPRGRGAAGAARRPLFPFPPWANTSLQTSSAGLPHSAPPVSLLPLPQGDTGCFRDHRSRGSNRVELGGCHCVAPSATVTCEPVRR